MDIEPTMDIETTMDDESTTDVEPTMEIVVPETELRNTLFALSSGRIAKKNDEHYLRFRLARFVDWCSLFFTTEELLRALRILGPREGLAPAWGGWKYPIVAPGSLGRPQWPFVTFVGGEPLCYDLYAINGLPRKLTYVRAEIEWFRKPIPRIGEMIGQTLRVQPLLGLEILLETRSAEHWPPLYVQEAIDPSNPELFHPTMQDAFGFDVVIDGSQGDKLMGIEEVDFGGIESSG